MIDSYAKEKFIVAVHGMATSAKSIQDRIADAFNSGIHLIKPDQIPEEVRFKYEEICQKMTSIKDDQQGSFKASSQNLSDNEAVEIAHTIVQIYDELCCVD